MTDSIVFKTRRQRSTDMQPTPPKSRKPQYRRPFYDAGKKTSAEIVSEARSAVRPFETSRPFTPAETNRRLFGNDSRISEGRPPSAFSIGPNAFSEPSARSGSRPPTGKLSPLKQIPDVNRPLPPNGSSVDSEMALLVRRSSDGLLSFKETSDPIYSSIDHDNKGMSNQQSKFPKPPKSMEPSMTKTGRPSSRQGLLGRRVQSGPKEHSNQRSKDITSELKKSNSFGSLERDIKSADSGVVSDAYKKDRRLVNECLSTNSGERPLSSESATSEKDSLKNSTDSGLNLNLTSNENKDENSSRLERKTRPESSSSEADIDNQATLFKDNVEPLLKQMELNYLHGDMDALSVNFDMLWKSLQFCGLLNKASGSGSARRRTTVLRIIFKFVDSESPEVILKLCKVALAMKVTGNNLVNICKLIFKISKDKTKDALFKENNVLRHITEIIRSADINLLFDGIIYATGSVKFLAANSILHDELLQADCIQCFVDLLNRIQSMTPSENQAVHLSHLIVQASAAIRNIADIPNVRASLLDSGLIRVLLDLLQSFWKDPDYMLNVSRILSKLTQYSDCCHLICDCSKSLQIFLKALLHHINEQDIVVRLAFILGNVAAKETDARTDLYFKYQCLDVFLDILNKYIKISFQDAGKADKNSSGEEEATEIEKANEILVKTVRVIANMSIDCNVAADIINNEPFLNIVLNILEIQTEGTIMEELLINTAGMLNNLSFYASEDSLFTKKSAQLTEALIRLLFIDNMDCITEATRVFGNLTRSKDIRMLLRERKVVEMLITLLESTDREVVFCSCGVLINLMVDNENRKLFHDDKGVRKLIDALKDFGQVDWQLSCMICQTLWNYSEKITSSISCFGEEETEDLIQILQDYTDPVTALDYSDNPHVDIESIDLMKQIWSEQFKQVGLRLLSRIEDHHTELRPLKVDPD